MPKTYEIRASYDKDTIVIYQAYAPVIADAAVAAGKFVAPFSFGRMTWIKPSFLWLMHRSNWGNKSGQQRTLAVRIKRSGWDKALSLGVLTHPEATVFPNPREWEREFPAAQVHVQWDTERSLRGGALQYYSIQVGISRHLIREFVDEWIVDIEDISSRVAKIRQQINSGKEKNVKRLLPPERVYVVDPSVAKRIMLS